MEGDDNGYHCRACGRSFPLTDGLPDFIVGELSPALEEERRWYGGDAQERARPERHRFAHRQARSRLSAVLAGLGCTRQSLVLDVAVGTGLDVEFIVSLTPHVVGVDITPWALRRFRQRFACPAYLADARAMPFAADSFDVVVTVGLLHHLAGHSSLQPYLAEFLRVARSGGALVAMEPNILFPLCALAAPVNAVAQWVRPGARGRVPHERPLSPSLLTAQVRQAGWVEVRHEAATFAHTHVPLAVSRFIAEHEDRLRRGPLRSFGWWTIVTGRKW